MKNRKPDSWYDGFFDDWIMDYYFSLDISLEECIQLQKEYDERIDNGQYLEYLSKYKIHGYKEFITENNSLKRNRENLNVYKKCQLAFESETGDNNPDLSELIEKCLLTLKQGFLVTNQLFILHDWVATLGEYDGDIGDSYYVHKKYDDIGDLF